MEIARGEINVELNDRDLGRELTEAEREVKASFARMSKNRANPEVHADLKGLHKDLAEATAELEAWEKSNSGRKAHVAELKVDRDKVKRDLRDTERELKDLRRAYKNLGTTTSKEAKSLRGKIGHRSQLVNKLREEVREAEDLHAEEAATLVTLRDQGTQLRNNLRDRARSVKMAERDAAANERATEAIREGAHEMRKQLADLQKRRARVEGGFSVFSGDADRRHMELQIRAIDEHIATIKHKLRAANEDFEDIDFPAKRTSDDSLIRFMKSLASTTVRVGPFTTSVIGLSRALLGLAPVLSSAVGALGALTAAVGSAALGFGALTAAVGGGALLVFGGMFAALKPVVGEMQNAYKASVAYDKAVREHGKGSTEAADKLEVFNNVMKNQSKEAKENFLAAGKLNSAWKKATEPSRARAFDVMGKGLKLASNNMDWFAKATNKATDTVATGIEKWMAAIDSAEGRNVMQTLMGNFTKALGPALAGLGNLIGHIAKVGAIASQILPGLMQGFKSWTEGLGQTDEAGRTLTDRVTTMMDSLRSLGRLTMSVGRLLYQFFLGGADQGERIMDGWTQGINSLTASLRTAEGQRGLSEFFERSINTMSKFWDVLKPILTAFGQWSQVMQPITNIVLDIAGAVASLVETFADLGAVQHVAQAAFAIFLGRKVVMGIVAVKNALIALRGAMAATAALGAGQALIGGLTGTLGKRLAAQAAATAAVGTAAKAAAVPVNAFTMGMAATGTAATGASAAAGTTAATLASRLGPAVAALASPAGLAAMAGGLALVGGGLLIAHLNGEKTYYSFEKTTTAMKQFTGQAKMNQATLYQQVQALHAAQAAEKGFRDTLNSTRSSAAQKRAALDHLVDAQNREQAARQRAIATSGREVQAAYQAQNSASKNANMADENVAVLTRLIPRIRSATASQSGFASTILSTGERVSSLSEAEQLLTKYTNQLAAAQKNAKAAAFGQAAAIINNYRALNGLSTYAGKAAQDVAKFARDYRKIPQARKFVLDAKDEQAGAKIARRSNQLEKLTSKKHVAKILADTKNPDQALNRLNKQINRIQGKEAKVKIHADMGNTISELDNVYKHLDKVNKMKPDAKTLKVNDNATGPSLMAIGSVRAFMALPDSEVLLTTRRRTVFETVGTPPSGGHGNATGGRATYSVRPENEVEGIMARSTKGEKVARPTMLVGEEHRPEYVIATNPAYRDRNENILGEVARNFGYSLIPAYAQGGGGPLIPRKLVPKITPKKKRRPGYKGARDKGFGKGKNRLVGAGRNLPFDRPGSKEAIYDQRFYKGGGARLEDLQRRRDAAWQDWEDWKNWESTEPHGKGLAGEHKRWKKRRPKGPNGKQRQKTFKRWDKYLKMATKWTDTISYWEEKATAAETWMGNPNISTKNFNKFKEQRDTALGVLRKKLGSAYNFARQHPGHKGGRGGADTRWEVELLERLGRATIDQIENEKALQPGAGEQVGPTQADIYASEAYNVLRDYATNVAGIGTMAPQALPDLRANPAAVPGTTTAPVSPAEPGAKGGTPKPVVRDTAKSNYRRAKNKKERRAVRRHEERSHLGRLKWRFHKKTGKGAWIDPVTNNVTDRWGKPKGSSWADGSAVGSAASSSSLRPSAGGSGGTTVNKTVYQTNTFQRPPADPHTWSQGTLYELQAA